MSFAHAELAANLEDREITLSVLTDDFRNFDMLSLSEEKKDNSGFYFDGECWLRYSLYPALKSYFFYKDKEPYRSLGLDSIVGTERKVLAEILEMLIKAEAFGWMIHIPYPKTEEKKDEKRLEDTHRTAKSPMA